MSIQRYIQKRNFSQTSEPSETKPKQKKSSMHRFVIQKHDATRLHYDFRLETEDGVLKSWAVPKGISMDPQTKRLAVLVEDHPLDYINFEGIIPKNNYGAGTVIVWDTGPYATKKSINHQLKEGKIKFILYGNKIKGSFSLIKIKNTKSKDENQWLLIKSRDEFVTTEDLTETQPESVLSKKTNETIEKKSSDLSTNIHEIIEVNGHTKEFPDIVKPMLALATDNPFDSKDWVFEVKWDGIRCLLFLNKKKKIKDLYSRQGRRITDKYPEIIETIDSSIKNEESIILDGELVVLNKKGTPDFQRHQKRMNVVSPIEIKNLSRETPATLYIFDILYINGKNIEPLQFVDRRKIIESLVKKDSKRIRISEYIEDNGIALFENVKKMGLEGIVAKSKSGKYLEGVRSPSWLKIKIKITQDCVVVGYTQGEGNREDYFGSLILGVYEENKLTFVGHCGSGFDTIQLRDFYKEMQKIKIEKPSIDNIPYVNRKPVWIKPNLVVEVKFSEWTQDKIMRAPIFVRVRYDKNPKECFIELPKSSKKVITTIKSNSDPQPAAFTNLKKKFWPKTSKHAELTKGDLIEYYRKISRYILPHLQDRPLSLSRYPDGILGKSFYHKNWSQNKPDSVKTIKISSESKNEFINYIVCNNQETLLWLANLGCIEMHPWYSRIIDDKTKKIDQSSLDYPDFIVFDLDPYIYSGREKKGEEPEFNVKGFQAASEIAFVLKDMLDQMNLKSFVKTSGKTGLHIFIPIIQDFSYIQTRSFATILAQILVKKNPRKITTEWSTAKRKGKVFFDHNQNARGKTISSIYSVRPTKSATVSMPIRWDKLDSIIPTDFTMLSVPKILDKEKDIWKEIYNNKQDVAEIIENVSSLQL